MNKEVEEKHRESIKHIGVVFPYNADDTFIDETVEGLKIKGLNIEIFKKPKPEAMAAIEWVIPTAIAAYILKPYFEGFLKEAGKDHYYKLKSWLKNFANKGRSIKVHTIYSDQTPNKKPNSNKQSQSVSVILQTKNDKTIKLLFDNDLIKEDWEDAIEKLLDFVIDNYEHYPKDALSKEMEPFNLKPNQQIYAIIDKDTKKLMFFDERGLLHFQNK